MRHLSLHWHIMNCIYDLERAEKYRVWKWVNKYTKDTEGSGRYLFYSIFQQEPRKLICFSASSEDFNLPALSY